MSAIHRTLTDFTSLVLVNYIMTIQALHQNVMFLNVPEPSIRYSNEMKLTEVQVDERRS